MTLEETAILIKKLKKEQLQFSSETGTALDYGKDEVYQLIPHRPPFNLVDRICEISLAQKMIKAQSKVLEDDPVFEGHFPDQPIYPGVFQIEMMAQAGLCLAGFVINQTLEVAQVKSIRGLFTRVHNAGFIAPVLPGNQLEILAQLVEFDDLLGIVAAQIIRADRIVAHSISEVYFTA